MEQCTVHKSCINLCLLGRGRGGGGDRETEGGKQGPVHSQCYRITAIPPHRKRRLTAPRKREKKPVITAVLSFKEHNGL